MTREEWELHHCWNEPYPAWKFMTWGERCTVVAAYFVLYFAVAPVTVAIGLWFFATMSSHAIQHHEDHERCLKQATNGYEIEKCR
jgi:hypothetical protein